MVMVHQQHQQQQQQISNNENGNQNGGSVKRGMGDGVWPPQNGSLRVKKPMLGGGRRIIGGPSTPVPRWKLYENPFYDGIAAAAAAAAQQQQQQQSGGQGGGRNVTVSARKLAATLWELQEFPFSLAAAAAASGKSSACPCIQHRSPSSSAAAVVAASVAAKKARDHLPAPADSKNNSKNGTSPLLTKSSFQNAELPHPAFFHSQQAAIAKESMVSLQHPNKAWENAKRNSQTQSTSNRQVAAMRSHVHRLLERRADARLTHLAAVQANSGSYMVLNRIQDIQEQHAAATPSSVVAALRLELERVRTRAHELELAHKSARREIDNLLKKVSEEKMIWRNKEQEKIKSAVQAVKMEAEEEKKGRRRMETVNRKMSRELIDANIALAKAVQELERERKARALMEDVCDELAREIGEDKAEAEELKRESAKVREEVEEERKMLQMAEVWREERVQMKLAEARLEIEDKNAILDNLRGELEAFLNSRKAYLHTAEEDEVSCRTAVQEAEDLKTAMDSLQLREGLENSSRSPDTDEEASGGYETGQKTNNGARPDERGCWDWGAQSTPVYGDAAPRLETRDEVLQRLRRKYEQNGQHASTVGAQKRDGGQKWEDERGDASEWNSQSEHQGDDAKEEEGSQWESASDQDIHEASQQGNPNQSTQGGGVEVEHKSGCQADAPVHAGGYSRMFSPQAYAIRPPAEFSPGAEVWKAGGTPLSGKGPNEEQQRRLSGEGSRNFLGRGMAEVSRSSHMRMVSDQGTVSPCRDWRSPDRGNPHIARGIKGFIEWPKMSRDNGVRGKVLESNIDKVDRRMLKQGS